MMDPNDAREALERALCDYTGARYCIATTRCLTALQACCEYLKVKEVTIPERTYNGVPNAIYRGGGVVSYIDTHWSGGFPLIPYPIFDYARRLTSGMYKKGQFQCLSFGPNKVLDQGEGGAILFDDPNARSFLRNIGHDGRTPKVHPRDDNFMVGMTCGPMKPWVATAILDKLSRLPRHNPDSSNSDYPDLSKTDWNGIWQEQQMRF